MGKKIIIAGAGHGGIVCGAILAEKGFKVDVYESRKRKDVGHDWTDVFDIKCFDEAGIPMPPADKYTASHSITYTNPGNSVYIKMPETKNSTNSIIDRKYLIRYLINYAEKKGVKFHFNTQITAPIADKTRVCGILISKNGKNTAVFGDLIIDSAGINSPVRSLLPERFHIMQQFDENQVFTAYRAFFNKIPNADKPDSAYLVNFYHMREPGLDWVITEDKHMDILIGRFNTELTQEQIDSAINDLRKKYPVIGEKLMRGGTITQIPIRRTLPIIVTDGYAAIGDCAAMTIPLIGSGIANSIIAGKYLADAVLSDQNGEFTAKTLWKYQYDYFNGVGNRLVIIDKLRAVATALTADDVDYLLEKEILSESEFALGSGNTTDVSLFVVIHKVIKSIPKLPVIANAAKTFAKIGTVKKCLNNMPKDYDEDAVLKWSRQYSEL